MMRRFVIALGMSLIVGSGEASAQLVPGNLLVSFHESPMTGADLVKNDVRPFVPFDFYIVSYSVPAGMQAYEFSLKLPAGMLIATGRFLPAGATDSGTGDDNWIVATGGICQGATGWFTMVRYAGALFLAAPPVNSTICPRGSNPSSFENEQPGYRQCAPAGELANFVLMASLPLGPSCAIINWTGVAAAGTSFGGLKAQY